MNLSFLLRNFGITVSTWWVPKAWSQCADRLTQSLARRSGVRGG